MKEIKHYICEMCGTEYNDKKRAQACERSHFQPEEIVNSHYQPASVDASGYPINIEVKMSDGRKVVYKRLRIN